MGKYKVIKVNDTDINNGFFIGQILEGDIKTVKMLPPLDNEEKTIFEPYDGDWFMDAGHVEIAEK